MPPAHRPRHYAFWRTLLLAAVLLLSSIAHRAPVASAHTGAQHWLGAWSTTQDTSGPLGDVLTPFNAGIANRTIRNIIRLGAGGSALRLRLSNAAAPQPVTFDAVFVGRFLSGAGLVAGSNRAVTFGGNTSVTIRPGAHVLSDPVEFALDGLQTLAVSLYSAGSTGPVTSHWTASQVNFVSGAGNWAWDERPDAFTTWSPSWYFLDSVDVLASSAGRGVIVALGDSITDGFNSSINANRRYSDYLAQLYRAGPPDRAMTVINQGMGGNRLLSTSPCFGSSALARLDRDVLSQTGVRAVIVLEGVNDLAAPEIDFAAQPPALAPCWTRTRVSAGELIAGYQQLIARLHAKGIRIYGGTIMPYNNYVNLWTVEGETKRQAVNAWIRTSGAFDGVIDFDAALRDPADPTRLLPQYNSGDNIHPNDAGYQVMADTAHAVLAHSGD